MRLLQASRQVAIPDDVTVEVKGRRLRVKGPRGVSSDNISFYILPMGCDWSAWLSEGGRGEQQPCAAVYYTWRLRLASFLGSTGVDPGN